MICIVVLLVAVCSLGLVACNGTPQTPVSGDFLKDVASISTCPDYESLLSKSDVELVNAALDGLQNAPDDADTQAKVKDAVMLLYDTANQSRINAELSLMVQKSLGGNEMGRVYMHGFTLQHGDKWYYQLASQAAKGDVSGLELIAKILSPIAGNLQVAYTNGDDKYHYAYIMGTETQLDCSKQTFPYATFIIPEGDEPKVYDGFEAYQTDRNCRLSQLELNNMAIFKELIKDGATIEHDDEKGFYTVKFEIDCETEYTELFEEFQKMSKRDLDTGSLTINNTIKGWRAELEIWDNGYAKAFRSYEDWSMVVLSFDVASTPSNEFEYLWDEEQILSVISQDENLAPVLNANRFDSTTELIDKCISYYSQPESVFVFDWFTLTGVLIGVVVGAIIIVVVVLAILLKKGKLPKLAQALQRDKERRAKIKELDKKAREERKERRAERKEARSADGENEGADGAENESSDNAESADVSEGDEPTEASAGEESNGEQNVTDIAATPIDGERE